MKKIGGGTSCTEDKLVAFITKELKDSEISESDSRTAFKHLDEENTKTLKSHEKHKTLVFVDAVLPCIQTDSPYKRKVLNRHTVRPYKGPL